MVAFISLTSAIQLSAQLLDLAPAAHLTIRDKSFELQWDEERDISEIRVVFTGPVAHANAVQYCFKNWPYSPPEMPSMEDQLDDPWQGEWLTANTREICDASSCEYTFEPLASRENPRADNLPGTVYRRTLKIRGLYEQLHGQSQIKAIQGFSNTVERARPVSIEMGRGEASGTEFSGWFSVYNGR